MSVSQTANGGQHCCRPPLYVRSGLFCRVLLPPFRAGSSLLTSMRLVALLVGARFARVGRVVGCRPGRVAPGLPPIRAFAQGRAAIRPSAYPRRSSARHSSVAPVYRDCSGCSFKRSGKSRPWAFPLCLVARSRPGFHLAGRTPPFTGVKCCSPSLSSPHRAGWRPKPARALYRGKRCRSAFRFRSRRPQFRASADQPEGVCRLVTLQTIRVRIVAHLILKIQRFGP